MEVFLEAARIGSPSEVRCSKQRSIGSDRILVDDAEEFPSGNRCGHFDDASVAFPAVCATDN